MGLSTAYDISAEVSLTIEQQLEWHLQSNHFPPIPKSMVKPCLEAIVAYNDDKPNRNIGLPDGIGYKGLTVAPAWAIIEAHHLEPWLADPYEAEDEDTTY